MTFKMISWPVFEIQMANLPNLAFFLACVVSGPSKTDQDIILKIMILYYQNMPHNLYQSLESRVQLFY